MDWYDIQRVEYGILDAAKFMGIMMKDQILD